MILFSPYLFSIQQLEVINGMKKKKTMEFMENDYIVSLYSCNFSLLVTDILISHNVERTTEDSQAESKNNCTYCGE